MQPSLIRGQQGFYDYFCWFRSSPQAKAALNSLDLRQKHSYNSSVNCRTGSLVSLVPLMEMSLQLIPYQGNSR